MKLIATRGKRLAAGIGLACAAAALPIAALAGTGQSGAPARTFASHRAALQAGQATPAVNPCRFRGTTVWMPSQGGGAAGHFYWEIEFSNTGQAACTLSGWPGVSAANRSGHLVGIPATHSGAQVSLTIPVGGTVHVLLTITDPGAVCAHPVSATQLKVYAPGQFGFHLLPFSVQVCPHTATMHVDTVHPNAGIPFYSIR
jgi:hypothetical protein